MEWEVSMEIGALVGTLIVAGVVALSTGGAAPGGAGSLFDLKAKSLQGKEVDLGDYRGKVLLVVNVASQCGFTPQYEGLEALHKELAGKGLVVLGFPSNEFGAQEPGTADEIATFCKRNYGVTFPMFAKAVVKPGPDQSPVYAFLTASGNMPSWNFCKYLVGRDGRVRAFFPSKVTPQAPELRDDIAAELRR
jgi:glutathione peroxidase